MIIDYVIEDELPLLKALAKRNDARLFYVVLTASQDELRQRLIRRGSSDLIERSLFLKSKLENAPENQAHLFNISGMTVKQELKALDITRYEL